MTASLDDIQGLFRERGVEFNAVRVRRHVRSKDFKGSLFLECISPEESDRVSSTLFKHNAIQLSCAGGAVHHSYDCV